MLLTEVESRSSVERLSSELHEPYDYFYVPGNDPRQINVSFLVKSELALDITYESHTHMKWRDPVDDRIVPLFTRDAPALILRRKGDDEPFLIIIGVHARSRRDSKGDPNAFILRSAEFRGYMDIVAKYQRQYGKQTPVMLAGDFNTNTLSAPEMSIFRGTYKSAFDTAEDATPKNERITHTFYPKDGSPTQAYQLDDIQLPFSLHHFVIEARVYRYKSDSGKILPFPRTIYDRLRQPSDHLPIYIRISTDNF